MQALGSVLGQPPQSRYSIGTVAPLAPLEASDLKYLDSGTATWLDIWGWTPDAATPQPEWKLPDPSIFIVGTDGRIKFEYVGGMYYEAVSPGVVLAIATCLAWKR